METWTPKLAVSAYMYESSCCEKHVCVYDTGEADELSLKAFLLGQVIVGGA